MILIAPAVDAEFDSKEAFPGFTILVKFELVSYNPLPVIIGPVKFDPVNEAYVVFNKEVKSAVTTGVVPVIKPLVLEVNFSNEPVLLFVIVLRVKLEDIPGEIVPVTSPVI